jgi:hypothetical protein
MPSATIGPKRWYRRIGVPSTWAGLEGETDEKEWTAVANKIKTARRNLENT